MKTFCLTCFAAVLLLVPACKKQEDKAPATTTTAPAVGSGTSTPTEATTEDHIVVLGHHKKPKPTDPVRLDFERFKVVKADFDPQKVEGGQATIEVDLSSFHTNSEERDEHLKSPSYLDVGKLATATISIDNVKLKADATYTADATVTAHGVTKTYPVTFDVLERTSDSVKIKGSHTFPRLDFGVGSDPAQNADESVGTDVTIEMVLTLEKA